MGHGARDKPPFAEYARDRFIIGDATFVKEEVARYREALGVDHFMMRCHWPGLEQEKVLGSIRRLGQISLSPPLPNATDSSSTTPQQQQHQHHPPKHGSSTLR